MPEEIKTENNFKEENGSPADRRRKFLKLALIFSAIIIVGAVASFAAPYFFAPKQPAQVSGPKPDEIVITKLPNGNQLVENKTAGYDFQALSDWSIPSGINKSGNGSVQLFGAGETNTSTCRYTISKISQGGNFANLIDWYRQTYGDEIETISQQTIKTVTLFGHPAIEVTTYAGGQLNGGVRNIYIEEENFIYGLGFSFSGNPGNCDSGLAVIMNSFKTQ